MKYLELVNLVDQLNEKYSSSNCFSMLKSLAKEFPDLTMVSSFGAESAVLLHQISKIDAALPVVFINTGKLYKETLDYKDKLKSELGLRNIKIYEPKQDLIQKEDPHGILHQNKPDLCCFVRKVEPLSRALANTKIWITGRKRFQGSSRSNLPLFELDDMRIKVNPLANWSREEIDNYFLEHNLPKHPLVKKGYLSIGCIPCTTPVKPGENPRAGRWRGQIKTECGIHNANFQQV